MGQLDDVVGTRTMAINWEFRNVKNLTAVEMKPTTEITVELGDIELKIEE